MADATIEYWAIIELMGHVRMAGKVSEVERYGSKVGRIDIPDGAGFRTQFFGGTSVYRETPCSEDVARAVASQSMPQPIHTWEMPRLMPPAGTPPDDADNAESCCNDYGDPNDDVGEY